MKLLNTSKFLLYFIILLNLKLSKPQKKNFLYIADALIYSDKANKSISSLSKLFLDKPDKFKLEGFFHSSVWKYDEVEKSIQDFQFQTIISLCKDQEIKDITVSFDDTTVTKYKDSNFELCNKVYDHVTHRYVVGITLLTLRISFGKYSFTIFCVPYISEKKIEELNKKYGEGTYVFKTKNEIARGLLKIVFARIPEKTKIFVCFDKWYSGKDTINFCLGYQNVTVICGIKSNRILDGKSVREYFNGNDKSMWIKKQVSYRKSRRTYLIHTQLGSLQGLKKKEVRIIASRLSLNTKKQVYFMCTDNTLSVDEILEKYANRWECETDYVYLKTRLGLVDFRVRTSSGIMRYFTIVHFILCALQFRQLQTTIKKGRYISLSEIIQSYRTERDDKMKKRILNTISNVKEREIVALFLD